MTMPGNYRRFDPDQIDTAVRHALDVFGYQSQAMARCGLAPAGLTMLEIGPGSDFAPALMLTALGARVILADRFLSEWQDDYHPELYRRLAAVWDGPKDQLLAAAGGGYGATTLRLLAEPAEALVSIPDQTIDFTYSGSVLEHVVDPAAVAAEASRVTKIGGWAAHSGDWRFHSDFSRPLEHLLWRDQDFLIAAEDCNNQFGNRFRHSEFEAHFEHAGMKVVERAPVQEADPAYLERTLPILRVGQSSYRDWPEEDLRLIVGWLFLQRIQGPPAELMRLRAADTVALMDGLKVASRRLGEKEHLEPKERFRELTLPLTAVGGPEGFMWYAPAFEIGQADTGEFPFRGDAVLFEDGQPLGPGHSAHVHIRQKGAGRFSHWEGQLFFSTSDNTSPLENGRTYSLRAPIQD